MNEVDKSKTIRQNISNPSDVFFKAGKIKRANRYHFYLIQIYFETQSF